MAYISVSIDVTSAADQIDTDAFDELFNALGRPYPNAEKLVERMRRDMGHELEDAGKLFLRACRDFYNEQFPEDKP